MEDNLPDPATMKDDELHERYFNLLAEMKSKLNTLTDIEGFNTSMDMLEEYVTDSINPGICMNPGCTYTTEVEPDQAYGWCEECQTGSVMSASMLAGII